MIARKVIEAQLRQYQNSQQQALIAFEQAKANLSALNGAIEACNLFLEMEAALVAEQSKVEVGTNKIQGGK